MYTLNGAQKSTFPKQIMKEKIILFVIFLCAVTLGNGLLCCFNITRHDAIVSNIFDKINLLRKTQTDRILIRTVKDSVSDICFVLLVTLIFAVLEYSLPVYIVFFVRCFVFGFCGGALVFISMYATGSVRLFTALFILYNIVVVAAMLYYCSYLITSKDRKSPKQFAVFVMFSGECGIIYVLKLAMCLLIKSFG